MYRKAHIEEAADLDNGVKIGEFIPKEDVSAAVLDRVVAGLCLSPHTKRYVKKYIGC